MGLAAEDLRSCHVFSGLAGHPHCQSQELERPQFIQPWQRAEELREVARKKRDLAHGSPMRPALR
eukprot:2153789-Pyramimonas_sp.AAC.1